jgi:hypothetical protein
MISKPISPPNTSYQLLRTNKDSTDDPDMPIVLVVMSGRFDETKKFGKLIFKD